MNNLREIFEDAELRVLRTEQVHGGDINQSFCLTSESGKNFLKINSADKFPAMFEKEARGLKELLANTKLIVPKVFKTGQIEGTQYVLMEWINKGRASADSMLNFGRELALMHKIGQPYFGFEEDNYIGSLVQVNTKHETWDSFYKECRILPLVKILFDEGVYLKNDLLNAESFCKRINDLFPEEPPALLHGDLWGGNFMIAAEGKAAIFDPAVYFGHREMDIGMTRLFGGFDQSFYRGYNEVYPLATGWEQRLSITHLYPLLVHAVLFGGHYFKSGRDIINQYA